VGFLTGTQGVKLEAQLGDLEDLPAACRADVRRAVASGGPWTAWMTQYGPTVAWGDYNIQGSKQLNAYLLLVSWWSLPGGHHSLWCYCDPKRPTEWTIGRGRHVEAH
jgi:hypothetical protein